MGGEVIIVQVELEDEQCWEVQDLLLNIVYEDDDIIVINKLCDFVVYFGAGQVDKIVFNVLLFYYLLIVEVLCVGIVYCFDKDMMGLMVVVKMVFV